MKWKDGDCAPLPIHRDNSFTPIYIIDIPYHHYMTQDERLKIEERIVTMLKTVYDPEIPVDIYNLGLIYGIDLDDDGNLKIDMTLTAPNCPAADFLVDDARIKLESIEGVKSVDIRIVFEPEWTKDMMTEEAKLDLGFL